MTAAANIQLLSGFDDPKLSPEVWSALLHRGDTNVVFLTWHWQRAWWESFGRGQLLLLLAEREGAPVALAPLFADGGMVFFTGSGGSDYLDFIGDISEPEILDGLLRVAREQTREFVGFRFYHVPDGSRTGGLLQAAAARLGLACHDEGDLAAPALDLASDPAAAQAAARKKSLVRHEKSFLRDGPLAVTHRRDGRQIIEHLPDFFEQHVQRWAATPHPSLFNDPAQRAFYRRLAELAADTGWLRFTRVEWQGRAIAHHFGFCYEGSFLWYKPAFAIDLARQSPGEVLLRHLLLTAGAEGAKTFDFGLGEEAFKQRFANKTNRVRTWGLYPTA